MGSFDESAEHIFPKIQEVIGAIRNLRSEYTVKPSQTVAVTISTLPEPARHILENREVIELLATCTLKQVGENLPPPPDAARTTAGSNEIFIEGLVDKEAEKQRATKQIAELTAKEAAMVARLANEAYTSKAPAHLVQQTRDELEKVLRGTLKALGKLIAPLTPDAERSDAPGLRLRNSRLKTRASLRSASGVINLS